MILVCNVEASNLRCSINLRGIGVGAIGLKKRWYCEECLVFSMGHGGHAMTIAMLGFTKACQAPFPSTL
jgi:hypothetical protein